MSTEVKEQPVIETGSEQVVEQNDNVVTQLLSYEDAIKMLKEKGGKEFKNVVITKATFSHASNDNDLVIITADTVFDKMQCVNPLTNEYVSAKSHTIPVSFYSLSAAISHKRELAFIVDVLTKNPELISYLLPGGTITIVQTPVQAGEQYYNPFSGKSNIVKNTSYYNDCIDINFSTVGEQLVARVVDKKFDTLKF